MKSLFRGNEERRREDCIKANIIREIGRNVAELLSEHQEEGVLRSTEVSNALCTNIEALFIHGLKETLMYKFSLVMAGPDQMPEPDFWSLLLVFSPRDIIHQIQKLSQISTDIGKCRAWVRLVLNEALLPGYLESIANQNSTLSPYYKKTALLRDRQMLSKFQSELNSVSNIVFDFPTNSCLLNYWPTPPLLMAGLWTPPIKLAPVPEGMDIASDIAAELPEVVQEFQVPNPYSSIEQVLYNEDEALKIILGTPVQDSLLESAGPSIKSQPRPVEKVTRNIETSECSTQIDFNDDGLQTDEKNILDTEQPSTETQTDPTESSNVQSKPFEPFIEKMEENPEEEPPVPKQNRSNSLSNDVLSYDVLLKSYNPKSSPREQNHLEDLLQTFKIKSDIIPPTSPSNEVMSSSLIEEENTILEYEVIPPSQVDTHNLPEFKNMVDNLGKLLIETGLLSQNFVCKSCLQHIGLTFAVARVCSFTGSYYCQECFNEKESVIPARILHNWDFSKHPVSGMAAEFLTDIESHPLIDIRVINPRLYFIVPEMAELQKQRMKLNLLRMYLFTCREPVIEALKKQLWPREYLYEHIHLYSISDLLEIPSSALSQLLSEVIKFCENHVIGCQLCFQKGFICEICNSKQIIYPFHLDTTYRCPKCGSVIHSECQAKIDGCPKCLRIQKRTTV